MGERGRLPNGVQNLPTRKATRAVVVDTAVPSVSRHSKEPPHDLRKVGKDAWRNALASTTWISTAADFDVLDRYARLADEEAALYRALGGSFSTARRNELRATQTMILKLSQVLGIGPSNRGRMGVPIMPDNRTANDADRAAIKAALREAA